MYLWGKEVFFNVLIEWVLVVGYSVFVIIVDLLVGGKRERDLWYGFVYEICMSFFVVLDGLLYLRWFKFVWLS